MDRFKLLFVAPSERAGQRGRVQDGLVSIIIITLNSADVLPSCLDSIRKQVYRDYEIIIVDNGSVDCTLACFGSFPVTCIVNPSNFGFSKANNQALQVARGEFVLFLNADATIAPDFLNVLIPYFRQNENLAAAAGKILRVYAGTKPVIDSTGLCIHNWRLLPRDRGDGEPDEGQYDFENSIFGVPGACALYRRLALDGTALGLEVLDNDFFAYYEDVDLAWRIKRQNWDTIYVPRAVAYHHKKGPWKKNLSIQIKAFTNRYWCYIKNEPASKLLLYAPIAVPYELLRVTKALASNPSWILVYFGELRLFTTMVRKRRVIRKLQR